MFVVMPYIRDIPLLTIEQIRPLYDRGIQTLSAVPVGQGAVTLADPVQDGGGSVLRIVDPETQEEIASVPVGSRGWEAIYSWTNVPTAFAGRLGATDPSVLRDVVNAIFDHDDRQLVVRTSNDHLLDMSTPEQLYVPTGRLLDLASSVVPDAQVIDHGFNGSTFHLDVVDPVHPFGDPSVDDISHRGLRIEQNVAKRLAPKVSAFTYRLVCTNGLEIPTLVSAVDGRGMNVDDMLANLEADAERLFSQIEDQIAHFYELRNEIVVEPRITLARVLTESKVSQRVFSTVMNEWDSSDLSMRDDVTMFDLINFITNQANGPVGNTRGGRRALESIGGAQVSTSYTRCSACHAVLVS